MYDCIILTNFSAFFKLLHLFINSFSTPFNSGNSDKIVLPPRATIISETNPRVGLADIPENPSDPPHSRPITSLFNGLGSRFISLILIIPTKVFLTASAINSFSDLLCCCSR